MVCCTSTGFGQYPDHRPGPPESQDTYSPKALGREVLSRRTQWSKTFISPDASTLSVVVSSGFLHYRDGSGRMEEIERTIGLSKDSTCYEAVKGLYRAKFALSFKKGEIEGNVIRYRDVFPGVDAEYEYTDVRLKQRIYLSPTARQALPDPSSYGFKTKQTDLVLVNRFESGEELDAFVGIQCVTVRESGKKSKIEFEGEAAVEFKAKKNKRQFVMMADAAYAPSVLYWTKNKNAAVAPMKRRFYQAGDRNYFTTGVPLEWVFVSPPGTIVLDPTISLNAPAKDTYLSSLNTSTNYGTETQLAIGKAASGKKRALIQFDLSCVPANAVIDKVLLKVYFKGTNGASYSRLIKCNQLLQGWEQTQATWNNRLTGTPWNTAGVGVNNADAAFKASDSTNWTNDFGWKTYNLTTLLRQWVAGTASNFGVLLWASNENDATDDEKYVYSSEEQTYVDRRPQLLITYTLEPLAEYFYDAQGKVVKALYADKGLEIDTYDPNRDWITKRSYRDKNNAELFGFENQYDLSGNVTHQNVYRSGDATRTMDYEYDDLHRITKFKYMGSENETYTYDDNGNRTSLGVYTYQYGTNNSRPNNRLTH